MSIGGVVYGGVVRSDVSEVMSRNVLGSGDPNPVMTALRRGGRRGLGKGLGDGWMGGREMGGG